MSCLLALSSLLHSFKRESFQPYHIAPALNASSSTMTVNAELVETLGRSVLPLQGDEHLRGVSIYEQV